MHKSKFVALYIQLALYEYRILEWGVHQQQTKLATHEKIDRVSDNGSTPLIGKNTILSADLLA